MTKKIVIAALAAGVSGATAPHGALAGLADAANVSSISQRGQIRFSNLRACCCWAPGWRDRASPLGAGNFASLSLFSTEGM